MASRAQGHPFLVLRGSICPSPISSHLPFATRRRSANGMGEKVFMDVHLGIPPRQGICLEQVTGAKSRSGLLPMTCGTPCMQIIMRSHLYETPVRYQYTLTRLSPDPHHEPFPGLTYGYVGRYAEFGTPNPLRGISASESHWRLNYRYAQAILHTGRVPTMIPPSACWADTPRGPLQAPCHSTEPFDDSDARRALRRVYGYLSAAGLG